jgi:hypothetical protein
MLWLKYVPIISIFLLLMTYTAFGWHVSSDGLVWSQSLSAQFNSWDINLEQQSILWAIHILALMVIVLTSLALTAPIALMTFFVGSWARSEVQSIISMVIWSFILVVMLRWFNYFIEFLVLICSAVLGRIELRNAGFSQLQAILILLSLCLASFGVGVYSYFHFGQYL